LAVRCKPQLITAAKKNVVSKRKFVLQNRQLSLAANR